MRVTKTKPYITLDDLQTPQFLRTEGKFYTRNKQKNTFHFKPLNAVTSVKQIISSIYATNNDFYIDFYFIQAPESENTFLTSLIADKNSIFNGQTKQPQGNLTSPRDSQANFSVMQGQQKLVQFNNKSQLDQSKKFLVSPLRLNTRSQSEISISKLPQQSAKKNEDYTAFFQMSRTSRTSFHQQQQPVQKSPYGLCFTDENIKNNHNTNTSNNQINPMNFAMLPLHSQTSVQGAVLSTSNLESPRLLTDSISQSDRIYQNKQELAGNNKSSSHNINSNNYLLSSLTSSQYDTLNTGGQTPRLVKLTSKGSAWTSAEMAQTARTKQSNSKCGSSTQRTRGVANNDSKLFHDNISKDNKQNSKQINCVISQAKLQQQTQPLKTYENHQRSNTECTKNQTHTVNDTNQQLLEQLRYLSKNNLNKEVDLYYGEEVPHTKRQEKSIETHMRRVSRLLDRFNDSENAESAPEKLQKVTRHIMKISRFKELAKPAADKKEQREYMRELAKFNNSLETNHSVFIKELYYKVVEFCETTSSLKRASSMLMQVRGFTPLIQKILFQKEYPDLIKDDFNLLSLQSEILSIINKQTPSNYTNNNPQKDPNSPAKSVMRQGVSSELKQLEFFFKNLCETVEDRRFQHKVAMQSQFAAEYSQMQGILNRYIYETNDDKQAMRVKCFKELMASYKEEVPNFTLKNLPLENIKNLEREYGKFELISQFVREKDAQISNICRVYQKI